MPAAGRAPWIIAGTALAGLLGALLVTTILTAPTPSAPTESGVTDVAPALQSDVGTPPDISSMSPRERFDRVYERVMRAARTGDEATISRFAPMALMAYGQLDTLDAGARYHAALIEVHSGDVAGSKAYAGFLEHYDAEMKAARTEYSDHKTAIEAFHAAARKAEPVTAGT